MKKQKENSREGITWSEMGKQNVQAEKVYSANSMLYPIQILWEWNVLFQVFPYHLNVNGILSCKWNTQRTFRTLTPRDLNWVQHWVSRIGLFLQWLPKGQKNWFSEIGIFSEFQRCKGRFWIACHASAWKEVYLTFWIVVHTLNIIVET